MSQGNGPATPPTPATMGPIAEGRKREYLFVVLLVMVGVGIAIVGLLIARPNSDNTSLVVTIMGLGGTIIASLSAYLKSSDNQRAIQEVHLSLNSRLTEWMESTQRAAEAKAEAAQAAGHQAGRTEVELERPLEKQPPTVIEVAEVRLTGPGVPPLIPPTPPTPPTPPPPDEGD